IHQSLPTDPLLIGVRRLGRLSEQFEPSTSAAGYCPSSSKNRAPSLEETSDWPRVVPRSRSDSDASCRSLSSQRVDAAVSDQLDGEGAAAAASNKGNKGDRRRAYQSDGRRPSLPALELGTILEQQEKASIRKHSSDVMSWSHQQQFQRRHRPSLVEWAQGDVVMGLKEVTAGLLLDFAACTVFYEILREIDVVLRVSFRSPSCLSAASPSHQNCAIPIGRGASSAWSIVPAPWQGTGERREWSVYASESPTISADSLLLILCLPLPCRYFVYLLAEQRLISVLVS
uniref:Uncharacterized protein n=1 Tax=Plectus sambesii TaxID=2011161 RepID=A0A914VSQ7_9BILA